MCTGLEAAMFGSIAGGTLMTLEGQKQAAEAQADQLRREAELGNIQAAFKRDQIQKDAKRLAGAQSAAVGKSGVTASGSVMEVMRQSAEDAEFAALAAQYGADLATQARQAEQAAVESQAQTAQATTITSAVGQATQAGMGVAK